MIFDGGDVRVVPSDRKADDGSSGDVVKVDLARARFLADPAALWRHAYAEFGRLLRRDFWTPTMSEVDWDGVLEEYRFLLDRVRTSAEFADLLSEVAAELGTSHAYVGPSHTFTTDSAVHGAPAALLGADVARSGDGRWIVERVLPGESSDSRARSPFAAPGVAVREGDEILAVDGRPLDPVHGPWPALAGTHGKPVELTIRPADPSLVPWPPAAKSDADKSDADKSDADKSEADKPRPARPARASLRPTGLTRASPRPASPPGPVIGPKRAPTKTRLTPPPSLTARSHAAAAPARTPPPVSPPSHRKPRMRPSPPPRRLPSPRCPRPAGSSSSRSTTTGGCVTRTGWRAAARSCGRGRTVGSGTCTCRT